MSQLGIKVAPTSREKLRIIALDIRKKLGFKGDYFPIDYFMDPLLTAGTPAYEFSVEERSIMKTRHGLTIPDQRKVMIREDVYDGACEGNGRDRFTMAHELGHFVLHRGITLHRDAITSFSEAGMPSPQFEHKAFEDSEWQANAFASELLMSVKSVQKCADIAELQERCGVSFDAARVRFDVLRGEGKIR